MSPARGSRRRPGPGSAVASFGLGPRLLLAGLLGGERPMAAVAQQAGDFREEARPPMPVSHCSTAQGCVTEETSVTMDAKWRWLHALAADKERSYRPCLNGLRWNRKQCPDAETCAQRCALEGLDLRAYERVGGVHFSNGSVRLKFLSPSGSTGSRLYLLDSDDTYKLFKLKNREFSFDVDVSKLPCGLSGAVYFVEMDRHGGKGHHNNVAGARYGTGYCDSRCDRSIQFVDGKANLDWEYGACCAEMAVWEANSAAATIAARPCAVKGPKKCKAEECGSGEAPDKSVCAKQGCGVSHFHMGHEKFYGHGPSFSVNTGRPFTVVTQFLTNDGSDHGELAEVRRLYVQDGKVINGSAEMLQGSGGNASHKHVSCGSLSDEVCKTNEEGRERELASFHQKGGLKSMGEALDRGMVLALSVDFSDEDRKGARFKHEHHLESSKEGSRSSPCAASLREQISEEHPMASVMYSNIRYGGIGTTFHEHSAAGSSNAAAVSAEEGKRNRTPDRIQDKFFIPSTASHSSEAVSGWVSHGSIAQKVAFLAAGLAAVSAIAALRWQPPDAAASVSCRRRPRCFAESIRPLVLYESI